jgi:predicted nucleic acid-binding protein
MSPFSKLVILDNNCISNFYLAESLELILSLWPLRTFVIPERVLTEASNWREHGQHVCGILVRLKDARVIEIVKIDDQSEKELSAYIQLRLTGPILGKGESESIAIASSRGYIVATDDGIATEQCKKVFPNIEVVTTAQIFDMAVADGLLTQSQVNEMWRLIRSKKTKH